MHTISKKIFLMSLLFLPAALIHADRHDHHHGHYEHLSKAEAVELIMSQRRQIEWVKFEYGFKGTLFGAILALSVPPLYKFIFK